MSSESSGARSARRYTGRAIDTLQQGQGVMNQPGGLFDTASNVGLTFGKSPLSMSPEVVALIKQRGYDDSSRAFQGALDMIGERQGAQGMYRSGGTNLQFQNAAGEFGRATADQSRQVDTQAALQRNQDFMNAIAAILPLVQQQQRPYEQMAQIYGGAASNQNFSQPGAGAGIGQGLGALLGALIP